MQILKSIQSAIMFFIGKTALPATTQKASIKFSALITAIKGSIGGTQFTSTKAGAGMQNNPSWLARPKRPPITGPSRGVWIRTIYWKPGWAYNVRGFVAPDGSQIGAENSLTTEQNIRTVSKAWQTLSVEDQSEWSNLARVQPYKNRLGEPYTASAFQVYMSYNLNRMFCGMGPLARPKCAFIKVIDNEAQEQMLCLQCDGETVWCIYSSDLVPWEDVGANQRMQTTFTGNTDAFLLIYTSPPMLTGRQKSGRLALRARVKVIEGYDNYLLRPMFNSIFGKHISNKNFNYKVVSISPGGAQTIVSQGTQLIQPTTAETKIMYTLKAQTFTWLGSGTTIAFGSVASGGGTAVKTILPYGLEMASEALYTIVLSGGDASNFSLVYGDPSDPYNLDDNLTDIYGNINPIPLQITFAPLTAGAKSATVTITRGAYTLVFTISGTGT